jgi:hypothetical protein
MDVSVSSSPSTSFTFSESSMFKSALFEGSTGAGGVVLVVPLVRALMTHKYRGCIVVLSINKSVEPNEEQKVLTSGFDQGFTVNTSKQVFRGIW